MLGGRSAVSGFRLLGGRSASLNVPGEESGRHLSAALCRVGYLHRAFTSTRELTAPTCLLGKDLFGGGTSGAP